MQDVVAFWTMLLQAVAEFLMLEPIIWFTAIFLLLAVTGFVRRII